MLNPQNMFLNIQDFDNFNGTRILVVEYNALKSCIPSSWKKLFLQNNNPIQTLLLDPGLIWNDQKNNFYHKKQGFIQKPDYGKIKAPTSIEIWVNLYPFMDNYNWKDIYIIPFKYT